MLLLQLPLLVLFFSIAQGDLIAVKDGNGTVACLTSNFESAVAFVKKPDSDINDFTKVEYLDGKGKPLLMSQYDCDLVQDASCNKWNKRNDDKITWVTSIPKDSFITDYRWNDLPMLLSNRKIKFTREGAPFHFSILSKNKVKIEVSDGRENGETIKAVIHRCEHKNSPLIQISDMKGPFVNVTDETKKVIHDCGTWIHVTIMTGRTNNALRIVENENRLILIFRRFKNQCGNLNCSIAFGDDKELLVKIHKFSYLHSRFNNEAMTLEASTNTVGFCVDVVFYFGAMATGTIFNLTITQGDEVVQKFTQGAYTKSKWVTRRFANESLTLNASWKLKVTAETPNIYIGGIKFCAGGDYNIVKPKGNHNDMESCHLLAVNDPVPTTMEKLTKVAGDVILCQALGGNCAGFKTCGENGTCVPFIGNTNDTNMKDSNINSPMATSTTLAATMEQLTQPITTAIIKTTAGETSKITVTTENPSLPEPTSPKINQSLKQTSETEKLRAEILACKTTLSKSRRIGPSSKLIQFILLTSYGMSLTMTLTVILWLVLRLKTVEDSFKQTERERQKMSVRANHQKNVANDAQDDQLYDDVGPAPC